MRTLQTIRLPEPGLYDYPVKPSSEYPSYGSQYPPESPASGRHAHLSRPKHHEWIFRQHRDRPPHAAIKDGKELLYATTPQTCEDQVFSTGQPDFPQWFQE